MLCFPVECSQSSISANSKNILDYLSDESSERYNLNLMVW